MAAGTFMATIPWFVAPAAPPPPGTLDAEVVDTTSFPAVSIDVTVPPPLRSLTISADMVDLAGGQVTSVAPVDPTNISVGLVIDDGPTVPAEVVEDAQGASVELVRNVGEGTMLALATPSGLQTASTSDRQANISRIAGITAGAPDVVPLPDLIVDAAQRLGESTETDRHLVLVLGSAPTVDVDALAEIVSAADIEVHLVAMADIATGELAALAASSGGVDPALPALVSEMDVATAAIAQRYRVEAAVDSAGPHELAVVVDGARYAATLDIPAPAPVPSSTTAAVTTDVAAAPAPPPDTASAAAPSTAAEAVAPTTAAAAGDSSGGGGSRVPVLVVAALVVAAMAGVALLVLLRRRTSGDPEPAPAAATPPEPEPESEPAPEPTPEPEPAPEPEPEPEPAPASSPAPVPSRPHRSAPTSRPRRGVAARRAEPVPVPEPAAVTERPAAAEPDSEWLVSGDLQLQRSTGTLWSGPREVSLTSAEVGVLELLMRSDGRGVTPEAIADAAGTVDADAVLTQLRRKTRLPGMIRRVRKGRLMLYFFDGGSGAR